MKPSFFKSSAAFRVWLDIHHLKATELYVGFYKVGSGKQNMTWSQSVDEALCFGWIDGVRRTIDADSYCIRFTPRKTNSNWSEVNLKKIAVLSQLGLMTPAGMAVFNTRKMNNAAAYSYENKPEELSVEFEEEFKKHPKSYHFFRQQSNSYQKTICYWVMSAKMGKTRIARLHKLIEASKFEKKLV